MPADIALTPQATDSESRPKNAQSTVPVEARKILERLSVVEFISIFGGIPIAVWKRLPAKTQDTIIREASFKLVECLGGLHDTIHIAGKNLDQIHTEVAQQQLVKYGNYTQAANKLQIDRRTLKTYLENDDVNG